MANLFLGVAQAPYRVDYYNYLHDNYGFEIYFQMKEFPGQLFSTPELEKECTYIPRFLRTRKVSKDRRIVLGLSKLIKAECPKVIIVPEFSIIALQVILYRFFHRENFKIVSQCDDSYDMLLSGNNFSFFHVLFRKICMPFLDDVVLADNRAAGWYRDIYHKGVWMPIIQNERVHNYLASDILDEASSLRNRYGLQGKTVILFVARLIRIKNFPVLVEACKKLTVPYHLFVVGDGEERQAWEQLATRSNIHVDFVGKKEGVELGAFYSVGDILVLPSLIEAFGAVVNEALLHGCTCLVSNRAGSCCIIEEGVNGYVINPLDSEELRSKIEVLAYKQSSSASSKMTYSFERLINDAFGAIVS